jgi:hypothetical protein
LIQINALHRRTAHLCANQKKHTMANTPIIPEDQLRRIDSLVEQFSEWEELAPAILAQPPRLNAWSVLQIVDHLHIVYDLYRPRIQQLLDALPRTHEPVGCFYPGWLARLSIASQRPTEHDERRWKMKTLTRFEPAESTETSTEPDTAFRALFADLEHLAGAVKAARYREVRRRKIVSGVGPLVKFYLPEAFEFLLAHTERHAVQIRETLVRLGGASPDAVEWPIGLSAERTFGKSDDR